MKVILRGALALFVTLLGLLAIEGILRLVGVGADLSFVVRDEQRDFVRTNPNFASLFFPSSFQIQPQSVRIPRRKPPGVLRIFVLGESAVQGVPAFEFSMVEHLRAQLRVRHPGCEFEIYNFGITAINSHVIRQIASDTACLEPDLVLLYVGNNEVIGPFGPGSSLSGAMPPHWLIRVSLVLRGTRLGQVAFHMLTSKKGVHEWRGMEMYVNRYVQHNDPRLLDVYHNFNDNLCDIVNCYRAAGANVLISTVVGNLADCPPFASLHGRDFREIDHDRFDSLMRAALNLHARGHDDQALKSADELVSMDPDHADAHYLRGTLREKLGMRESARVDFVAALHLDCLRFRPDAEINRIIRRVATHTGVELVDVATALGATSEPGQELAGSDILYEHVHFNFEGNLRVAQTFTPSIERALNIAPGADFADRSEAERLLGYSPFAAIRLQRGISMLCRNPPFTNQMFYAEQRRKFDRDVQRIGEQVAGSGGNRLNGSILASSIANLQTVLRDDADNLSLLGLLRELKVLAADRLAVLTHVREERNRRPWTKALEMDHAVACLDVGQKDECSKTLAALVKKAEWLPEDFAKLAPIYDALEGPESVELWYRKGLGMWPGVGVIERAYAKWLGTQSRVEEAWLRLRSYMGNHPWDDVGFDLLLDLNRFREQPMPEIALRQEFEKDLPRHEGNELALGMNAHDKGNTTLARVHLRKSVEAGTRNLEALLTLAHLEFESGAIDEMYEHLHLALVEARYSRNSDAEAAIVGLLGDDAPRVINVD